MDNKSLSHTRWKCQYHIVFIPKYLKKVLYGKAREDVREFLSTLCKYKNVEIIAGVQNCKASGTKHSGRGDIMWRQLVISLMRQYKSI